jgi:antitoxin HicB
MEITTTKDLAYYMALRYRIVLNPEEDGWSAIIPDLPGCMGAGDTIQEALEMLADAKQSWLTASLEMGLPVQEPKH